MARRGPGGRGADHFQRTYLRPEQDERFDRWRGIGTGHRVGTPGPAGRSPAGPDLPARAGTGPRRRPVRGVTPGRRLTGRTVAAERRARVLPADRTAAAAA